MASNDPDFEEVVALLTDLIANQPEGRAIHIILDSRYAHKTRLLRELLEERPNARLHFIPTYNRVELWFSTIERDLIHRGVFTSVTDLSRRIMTYIRRYNDDAKPSMITPRDASASLNVHRLQATGGPDGSPLKRPGPTASGRHGRGEEALATETLPERRARYQQRPQSRLEA